MERAVRRGDRDYAGWIVVAIVLVVLAGFSRSFFLLPLLGDSPPWAAPEPVFYLHGFVFSAWFVLLAVQTWLVRAGSLRWHRRLGYAGAALAVLIFGLGTYSAIVAANRPGGFIEIPFPPEQFLLIPLLDMATFAGFVTLGVLRRNRAASHKRWMLLASITLLGAPVARLPLMVPTLPVFLDLIVYAAFVTALAVWDFDTRRRISRETLWGGGAILVLKFFALPIAATQAWTGLALTIMGWTLPA